MQWRLSLAETGEPLWSVGRLLRGVARGAGRKGKAGFQATGTLERTFGDGQSDKHARLFGTFVHTAVNGTKQ